MNWKAFWVFRMAAGLAGFQKVGGDLDRSNGADQTSHLSLTVEHVFPGDQAGLEPERLLNKGTARAW